MAERFFIPGNSGAIGEFIVEDGVVHRRVHTPGRDAIMARNRELQRNPGAVKTTSFGKLELDIPVSDMQMLDSLFPGMADPAAPNHKEALRAFIKSPASDPYRLQERKRGINRGTHIAT